MELRNRQKYFKWRTIIDYPFIKAYRVESELITLGENEDEIND